MDEYVRVSVDYTLSAARVFATQITPKLSAAERPFRFVFCSGHATELDESSSLWIMGPTRKVKGRAEKGLFTLADAHPGTFEAYAVRPCGIYQPRLTLTELVLRCIMPFLRVQDLAATMVDVAKNGFGERIVDHLTASRHGTEVVRAQGW